MAVARAGGFSVSWHAATQAGAEMFLRRKPASFVLVNVEVVPPGFESFMDRISQIAPRPVVIATGVADRTDVFRLAVLGVDGYAEFLDGKTLACIGLRLEHPEDDLFAVARRSLGRLGVKEAQKVLRAAMLREALRVHAGNRHAMARILRVNRRYILKMLKELSDADRVRNVAPNDDLAS